MSSPDVKGISTSFMDESCAGAAKTVNDILQGAWKARAIHVAVELGIPELLASGPRSVSALAEATGTHQPTLRRVLRLLARVGIFTDLGRDDLFGQSELSEVLRPGPANLVAADARFQAAPWHWRAWEQLGYSLRTGRASFEQANGVSFWQRTREDPEARELFNAAMGSVSLVESTLIPKAYDFSDSRLIVDIGGGCGSLLAAILEAVPDARGRLLERPAIAEEARELLACRGLEGRYEIVPGDFFETIPDDADSYILKHVLHDWNDEDVIRILGRIRESMSDESRLLVIDNLIDDNSFASTLFVDLLLLVLVGGGERTKEEFAVLFEKAGLRVERSLPVDSGPVRIIETRRA
jgi:hypothetical protein